MPGDELTKVEDKLSTAGERWLEARAGGNRSRMTKIESEVRVLEDRLEQLQKEET